MASYHRLGRGLQGYLHFVTLLRPCVGALKIFLIGANFWSQVMLDIVSPVCYIELREVFHERFHS